MMIKIDRGLSTTSHQSVLQGGPVHFFQSIQAAPQGEESKDQSFLELGSDFFAWYPISYSVQLLGNYLPLN